MPKAAPRAGEQQPRGHQELLGCDIPKVTLRRVGDPTELQLAPGSAPSRELGGWEWCLEQGRLPGQRNQRAAIAGDARLPSVHPQPKQLLKEELELFSSGYQPGSGLEPAPSGASDPSCKALLGKSISH